MSLRKYECTPKCRRWQSNCEHEVLGFGCFCRVDDHTLDCPNYVAPKPETNPELDRLKAEVVSLKADFKNRMERALAINEQRLDEIADLKTKILELEIAALRVCKHTYSGVLSGAECGWRGYRTKHIPKFCSGCGKPVIVVK